MAKVRIKGDTSGYYDLTVPSVAGDNTLSMADMATAVGMVSGDDLSVSGDVTATGDVTDSVGNLRAPRYTTVSTATTISDEGVYYCTSNPTLTLGTPAAGCILCIYNDSASSMTLEDGSTITSLRLGADNNNTHNNSVTIAARAMATVTVVTSTTAIVTGTDVS